MQTRDEVRFLKPIPQIWKDALNILAKTLSPGAFALLDTAAELKFFNAGLAVVGVSNQFYISLISQSKAALQEALLKATGVPVMIEFVVDNSVNGGNYTGTFADIDTQETTQQSTAFNTLNGGIGSNANVETWSEESSTSSSSEQLPEEDGSASNQNDPFSNDDAQTIVNGSQPGIRTNETSAIRTEPTSAAPNTVIQIPSRPNNIVTPIIPPASQTMSGQAARNTASPAMGRLETRPMPRQNHGGIDLVKANLSAKHTFATFVVGSNNRFCHSAALAVAQSPGQNYNPLFIYGGVGLGKTHLMQAIGYAILENNPQVHVRYLSCERFTNDLINSIRDKTTGEFRKRYRNVDVLLIDDIQFIEGKESTQEEFFHTFNHLRESGKQIVLSSDRPPKAFSRLEERLRSRFEWGLTSDMQAPDYETRLAILRKKCDSDKLSVDDSTLSHIATLFTSNIRELEGALIRVSAYTRMTGKGMDQNTLHSILTPNGTPKAKPTLTIDSVIAAVAEHYKVDSAALRSSSRSADITLPRHIAMHLAHELMHLSFPRIGEAFGNRRHTSVMHANTKVKGLLNSNPNVAAAISQIRRQLGH